MLRKFVACFLGGLIVGWQPSVSLAGAAPPIESARIQLGERLFSDSALSADGHVSCASCHQRERAFTDGRPTSIGVPKSALSRNAPSLLDVKDRRTLFWDGRTAALEDQVALPMFNPVEHGLRDESSMIGIIRSSAQYRDAFVTAFPEDPAVTLKNVSIAIAAFERTLVSEETPFDRFLGGVTDSGFSEAAQRGWAIFRGGARCTQCHRVDGGRPALTDESFHPSPLSLDNGVLSRLPTLIRQVTEVRKTGDAGALSRLISADRDVASLGRFVVSLDPSDIGLFRTPSLRNVAATAPYMHDGSVATLEQAVDLELYRQDGTLRKPVALSPQERADLIEFLHALSSAQAMH